MQKTFKRRFTVQLIMDCKTTPSITFKNRVGFIQQDPIMTQEQSILTQIRSMFPTESIIFQYHALGYKIDAYFEKHKLAIEIDERGHNDRDLECEVERQKAIEEELNCKFIRINPAKEDFDIFFEIDRIQTFVVKSGEKSLIKKISDRL